MPKVACHPQIGSFHLPYAIWYGQTDVTIGKCYYLFSVFIQNQIWTPEYVNCREIDKCTKALFPSNNAVLQCSTPLLRNCIDWTGPFLCTLRTLDFYILESRLSLSTPGQNTIQHQCCWCESSGLSYLTNLKPTMHLFKTKTKTMFL